MLTWPLQWRLHEEMHPHVRLYEGRDVTPPKRGVHPPQWDTLLVDSGRIVKQGQAVPFTPRVPRTNRRYLVSFQGAPYKIFGTDDLLEFRCWLITHGYLTE